MNPDQIVRQHLLALLRGGNAHMPLADAVADFPMSEINTRPPNTPYTPWHLLEHLRIAQGDILDFIRNPDYQYLKWPDDYWPHPDARADAAQWRATLDAFDSDLNELIALVADPSVDLYADLQHAAGYNILREILLVADHNAYHIGEFAILRQVMGTWPQEHA